MLLAVLAASCSAGFSRPRGQALVEDRGGIYALVNPDPNRNTDTTVARLQFTADGHNWDTVDDQNLPGSIALQLNEAGITGECDDETSSCYRVLSPEGGISLQRSRDAGETWAEVWGISAARLDYQNRCCGTRSFAINDLEYVPESGLVAVALAEYGILTRGTDAKFDINTLGRAARPESGLMVGLFTEPLFAAIVALAVGYVTIEQRLSRLRSALEVQLGSTDHVWLTGRARQVPLVLPLVFFLALGGVGGAIWRTTQLASRDLPPARGWFALGLAVLAIAAVAVGGHLISRRRWQADAETRARGPFAAAAARASRAQLMGTVSTTVVFVSAMLPLVAWTTGEIESFDSALKLGLGLSALGAAAFWVWEATRPPIPGRQPPSNGRK
ncbi:MAG: hypothetical protein HKN80_04660 [Acidimicrobiia bacterium]|nr:hypothetical protein [Acidimicrobiia bacterium]